MDTLTFLRSFRIFNVALFDLSVAFLGAYIIHLITHLNLLALFLLVIPLGIVFHYLFHVDATLLRLFKSSILFQIIILSSVVYAFYLLK